MRLHGRATDPFLLAESAPSATFDLTSHARMLTSVHLYNVLLHHSYVHGYLVTTVIWKKIWTMTQQGWKAQHDHSITLRVETFASRN